MSPTRFHQAATLAAFIAGLVALGWIAAGYAGTSPFALAMTGLIAAVYLAGSLELRRFDAATRGLAAALQALPRAAGEAEPGHDAGQPSAAAPASANAPATDLPGWLARLHPTLRPAVRQRIDTGTGALPGPATAPYLAGLLVLLGMLGTFLGMVATLRGTGVALETATDVATIRASLAAPVHGLGLAFGTSVAGVAASAMLGLMSTLARRARSQVALQLDAAVAGPLHPFGRAARDEARDEARAAATQALLQRQAEALPLLADRIQAAMAQLEHHGQTLAERLVAQQAELQAGTRKAQAALAQQIERSLAAGLAESARQAGAAIQPVAQATLDGLARQSGALQQGLVQAVQGQLEGLATRFDAHAGQLAQGWQAAMAGHVEASRGLTQGLHGALGGLVEGLEQRTAALLDGAARAQAQHQQQLAERAEQQAQAATALQQRLAETAAEQAAASTQRFEQQAAALLEGFARAHAEQQAAASAQDAARLAAWTAALQDGGATLQQQWQQATQAQQAEQARIAAALAQTAGEIRQSFGQAAAEIGTTFSRAAAEIGQQGQAHAEATRAEVARLLQAAAEAPQAAAQVIGELRAQLSGSLQRDNAALAERERLLQTVDTLLARIDHASGAQQAAIDALVQATGTLMARAGERFEQQVQAQAERLGEAAVAVAAGSADIASLGEAFGHAVQLFGDGSRELLGQLQRLEAAMGQTLARSDEQLAYTVAQARELIELSVLTQKRVVDELQQLARRPAANPAAA